MLIYCVTEVEVPRPQPTPRCPPPRATLYRRCSPTVTPTPRGERCFRRSAEEMGSENFVNLPRVTQPI